VGLDHLWAGWRRAYIESITDTPPPGPGVPVPAATEPPAEARAEASTADHGRAAPAAPTEPPGSLFERILGHDDEEGYIVRRGRTCAVLLNAYPYTNGHLLVLPNRAVAALGELTADEHVELWQLVREGVAALEAAYRCDGVNVGMNLGKAAGAGVPEHLHAHVLPRWDGDTNFMTTVAETRVMPEALSVTWHKLRAAWPAGG
jgi:ATP adenylyltransferase